jgi:hypothetical protein
MSEPAGSLTLRERDSSVLVQEAPLERAPVDGSEIDDCDGRTTVGVRFGRPTGADDVVVAPVDPDSVDGPAYPVDGPADLTGYGVALDKVLDDVDEPLLIRVDSLTALLQHATLSDAFRFVHVLSGRTAREEAVLVAAIDAAAHDEETVAAMLQPFDVTVTPPPDYRVRRRG